MRSMAEETAVFVPHTSRDIYRYIPDSAVRYNSRMIKQRLIEKGPDPRLVEAIESVLKEKGWSPRKWSMEATGKPDTVRQILNGRIKSPGYETLRALEAVAGRSLFAAEIPEPGAPARPPIAPLQVPDLSSGLGPADLQIVGAGAAGPDGRFDFNGSLAGFTKRPPKLAGVKDAYAIYVNGDSMRPWRHNGSIVMVNPHQPVNIEDFVVVQLHPESDGAPIPAYIKQLMRRTEREVRLYQFNPAGEIAIQRSKIGAIHRIVDWEEALGI